MGNQRVPGPLSQADRPVTLHPGINALTHAAVPGPTGAKAKGSRWISLSVDSAESLPRGDNAPANTRFYALTAGLASCIPIYIEAKSSEDPPPTLRWTGGEPSPDKIATERLLLTNTQGKFSITCTDGQVTATAVIYVVKVVLTEFRGDNGGTFHTDNKKTIKRKDGKVFNTSGLKTGRNTPTGNIVDFNDFCETQYTVQPSEFVADGKSGVIDTTGIQFLLTRQKQAQAFLGDPTNWAPIQRDAAFVDDTDTENQMNDPWNADGHLYSNDGPGFQMAKALPTANRLVVKQRLRERVKVTFDGSPPAEMWTCSDEFAWHDFRSMELRGPKWVEVVTFGGNELIAGDKDFLPLPM